jgi:hypothetical protein
MNFLDILISPINPVVKAIFKFFDLLSVFFPWLNGYIVVLIVVFCYILYLLFISALTGFISFKIWSIIKLKNINKSELIQIELLNEEDIYKLSAGTARVASYVFLKSLMSIRFRIGDQNIKYENANENYHGCCFCLSSCVDLSYSGGDPHEQTSVFRYQ